MSEQLAGKSDVQDDDRCMVIESDSDGEDHPEGKKAKVSKTHSKDEILVLSDTDEPPVVIIDDESEVEGPVAGLLKSIKKEKEEPTVSEYYVSGDTDEQAVGEKPADDPEAKLKISDIKTETDKEVVGEQPKKRKYAIKSTGVKRLKVLKPSTKSSIEPKHGNGQE
ncbi:uncharacterized protein RBU33_014841 [Hipposideros larvatus]